MNTVNWNMLTEDARVLMEDAWRNSEVQVEKVAQFMVALALRDAHLLRQKDNTIGFRVWVLTTPGDDMVSKQFSSEKRAG